MAEMKLPQKTRAPPMMPSTGHAPIDMDRDGAREKTIDNVPTELEGRRVSMGGATRWREGWGENPRKVRTYLCLRARRH